MKQFYILILATLSLLGCDETQILKPVIDPPIDLSIPEWDRIPNADIILEVPDHLVFEPIKFIDPTKPFEPNKDESLLLRNFTMSNDYIYVSDLSGKNIYVFNFEGVMIKEEKLSRNNFSTGPPRESSYRNYSTADEERGILASQNGELILQQIMWKDTELQWHYDLVLWTTINAQSVRYPIDFEEYTIRLLFYENDLMYVSKLDKYRGQNLSVNTIYAYYGIVEMTEHNIVLEGEVFRVDFATEEHIYGVSNTDLGFSGIWTVWTKGGKRVGYVDFNSDRQIGGLHYHNQSETLYAWDELALQHDHKYVLLAFQQE